MTIQDYALNPIDANSASFAAFGAADVFPHDIYSFLIESIRIADRDLADLFLLRYLEAMQSEFEDTYERIESLRNLLDPDLCPVEGLKYLKWIVGFTSRLDFLTGDLSEDQLRLLISIGARMWKLKGTDAGLAFAIGAVSTYPVRILPWFFFRTLVDEVEVGRAELDVDPWLIDRPGMNPSVRPDGVAVAGGRLTFDLTTLLGATEAVPHDVRIRYVPGKETQVGRSYWHLGANRVLSGDLFGQAAPSTNVDDYRVGVDPDEYVSDLRVIDTKVPGALDRDLVENLVRVLRPHGERYFVRYLDFADTFRGASFWSAVTGAVSHDPDEGRMYLGPDAAESEAKTDFDNDGSWTEYQAMVQFKLRDGDASKWFDLRFYYTNPVDHYAVRVNPTSRTVSLERMTAGVRTVLDSVVLPAFHLDTLYVIRVATLDTGAGHQIKYYLSGNLLGTVVDADHAAGKLAVATAVGQLATVTFAELFQFPLESTRIGPGD
jgi:phage tail-like protein